MSDSLNLRAAESHEGNINKNESIVSLTLDSSMSSPNNDSNIHLLPCSIEFHGPAPVSSYFHVTKDANGNLSSHFRGRLLRGASVPLPDKVQGLCVTKKLNNDTQRIDWEIVDKFSAIVDWEHHTFPQENHLQEYLDWFELSNSVSLAMYFYYFILYYIF